MENKTRLDAELVNRRLASSRTKAKEHITNGFVTVNGKSITKASFLVSEFDTITCNAVERFVGRGGYKIEAMMQYASIDVRHLVCMDVGASTGGFTQCLLDYGADKVYAVDVGHGQLHPSLRIDSRVVNLESTDIRNVVQSGKIQEEIDFCSIDVSFISLKYVLPSVHEILKENGTLIALIKPQFEVGKAYIGKNGIVKDKKAHIQAIKEVFENLLILGFEILSIIPSPITGGDGNVEYLVYASNSNSKHLTDMDLNLIKATVAQGHTQTK